MIYAYSDCSVRHERVTIAAIVVTDTLFIDYEIKVLEGVKSTAQGELRGVILAMELINRNFKEPQEIKLWSDCISVIEQYARSLETGRVPRSRIHYDDWVNLMKISKGHHIEANHIKAHKTARSYNVICDFGVRTML